MRTTLGLIAMTAVVTFLGAAPVQALSLKLLNNGNLVDIDNSTSGVSASAGGSGNSNPVKVEVGGKALGQGNARNDVTADVGIGGNTKARATVDALSPARGTSVRTNISSGSTNASGAVDLLSPTRGTGLDLSVSSGALGTGLGLDLSVGVPGLGGTGGGGGGGNGNGGAGSGGSGNGGVGGGQGGGVLIASLGTPDLCAAPTAARIDALLERQAYDYSMLAQATRVKIVPVEMCLSVRDRLAAILTSSASVGQLQQFLSTSTTITQSLSRKGYSVASVVAVERSGATLVIYVI